MDAALLAARLVVCIVFLVAGLAKLVDLKGSRQAIIEFGLPKTLASAFGLLLPLVEVTIAIALLPTSWAWWGALGAGILLLMFVAIIGANLAQGRKPDCHCFGQVYSEPVGLSTLIRNIVLAGVAGFIVLQGRNHAGLSAVSWIGRLTVAERVGTIVALLALGLLASQWWFLIHLLSQNGRLVLRLESVEAALVGGGRPAPSPAPPAPVPGLPVGAPAPEFDLRDLNGAAVSLDSLLAEQRRIMLVFSDPSCSSCAGLLPDIGRWQSEYEDRLTIAVISSGTVSANKSKIARHGVTRVLLQLDHEVSAAYDSPGTPTAVLIRADGTIGSPLVGGEEGIRALASREFERAKSAPIPLLAEAPRRETAPNGNSATQSATLAIGDIAPDFTLQDLDGRSVRLSDYRGTRTLLVFWSTSCGFCQRMLPELKEWENDRPKRAPEVVLVSTSPAADNAAMGLRSRVLLDPTSATSQKFHAGGTPMAVLIDDEGKISSEQAAGAPQVMALAGVRPRETAPA